MSRCLLLSLRSSVQPIVLCLLLGGTASAQAPPPPAQAPPPPPASPSPEDEAARGRVRQLVQEAGLLMERGDRQGAVAKLLQAQQLRPDPSLDYNLGVAYGEWGRPAEAAAAFSRFLRAVKAQAVTGDRIEDARRRLEAYRKELGRVSVTLAAGAAPGPAPKATVLIDNRTLGPAPLLHHLLAPGTHEVRVTSPGARDYIVSLPIAAGEDRAVSAQLVPLPKGGEALAFVPPQGPPPPPPVYKRWWLWTAAISGAALTAGLIGAGAGGAFNRRAPGSDLDALLVGR